jgi:two-component system, chemotaxis family, chemotaxis protein CheY
MCCEIKYLIKNKADRMNQEKSDPDLDITRTTIAKVVLVGHCGFDQGSISRAVAVALPDVAIESAYNTAGLHQHAAPDALLLVNRVLDGRFGTGSGIDLIAELSSRDSPPQMMLISNYPESQAQAVKAGALPGFGKSELGQTATTQKLQSVWDGSHTADPH